MDICSCTEMLTACRNHYVSSCLAKVKKPYIYMYYFFFKVNHKVNPDGSLLHRHPVFELDI